MSDQLFSDDDQNNYQFNDYNLADYVSSLHKSGPVFDYPPITFNEGEISWKIIAQDIISPFAPKFLHYDNKGHLYNGNPYRNSKDLSKIHDIDIKNEIKERNLAILKSYKLEDLISINNTRLKEKYTRNRNFSNYFSGFSIMNDNKGLFVQKLGNCSSSPQTNQYNLNSPKPSLEQDENSKDKIKRNDIFLPRNSFDDISKGEKILGDHKVYLRSYYNGTGNNSKLDNNKITKNILTQKYSETKHIQLDGKSLHIGHLNTKKLDNTNQNKKKIISLIDDFFPVDSVESDMIDENFQRANSIPNDTSCLSSRLIFSPKFQVGNSFSGYNSHTRLSTIKEKKKLPSIAKEKVDRKQKKTNNFNVVNPDNMNSSDKSDEKSERQYDHGLILMRRKSCICYDCGGECAKLQRASHIIIPSELKHYKKDDKPQRLRDKKSNENLTLSLKSKNDISGNFSKKLTETSKVPIIKINQENIADASNNFPLFEKKSNHHMASNNLNLKNTMARPSSRSTFLNFGNSDINSNNKNIPNELSFRLEDDNNIFDKKALTLNIKPGNSHVFQSHLLNSHVFETVVMDPNSQQLLPVNDSRILSCNESEYSSLFLQKNNISSGHTIILNSQNKNEYLLNPGSQTQRNKSSIEFQNKIPIVNSQLVNKKEQQVKDVNTVTLFTNKSSPKSITNLAPTLKSFKFRTISNDQINIFSKPKDIISTSTSPTPTFQEKLIPLGNKPNSNETKPTTSKKVDSYLIKTRILFKNTLNPKSKSKSKYNRPLFLKSPVLSKKGNSQSTNKQISDEDHTQQRFYTYRKFSNQ